MRSPTASTACRRIAARDCAGQATVEFALVTVAFLSVVLGMGALWRSVSAARSWSMRCRAPPIA